MECPYCGKKNSVSAVVGAVKTVSCNSCGRGHHSKTAGIPAKVVTLDLWGVLDEIKVRVGKRTVTLPAFTAQERAKCGELVGGHI